MHSNSFNNSIDRLGTGTAVSGRAIQKIPWSLAIRSTPVALSPWPTGSHWLAPKPAGQATCLDGVSNRRADFGGISDAAFSIYWRRSEKEEVEDHHDVTNGRGSGGVVVLITKSGNGIRCRVLAMREPALAANKDVNDNHLTNNYKTDQFGGSSAARSSRISSTSSS